MSTNGVKYFGYNTPNGLPRRVAAPELFVPFLGTLPQAKLRCTFGAIERRFD